MSGESFIDFAPRAVLSEADPIAYARSIFLGFPLWKLENATVQKAHVPDTSNPGGYYDRWVVLRYTTWFGRTRTKILYSELAASDERKQDEVYGYAEHLLKTIKASL